jgi:hypothetical protein
MSNENHTPRRSFRLGKETESMLADLAAWNAGASQTAIVRTAIAQMYRLHQTFRPAQRKISKKSRTMS